MGTIYYFRVNFTSMDLNLVCLPARLRDGFLANYLTVVTLIHLI